MPDRTGGLSIINCTYNNEAMSESNPPGKRRFYQNVLDAYRLTKRTYPALPWMLLGTAAAVIAVFMLVAWLTNMSFIGWLVVGIMGSFTAALALLSILTRRALYSQVEDTAGAVKVALSTGFSEAGGSRAARHITRETGPRVAYCWARGRRSHLRRPRVPRPLPHSRPRRSASPRSCATFPFIESRWVTTTDRSP